MENVLRFSKMQNHEYKCDIFSKKKKLEYAWRHGTTPSLKYQHINVHLDILLYNQA